MSADQQPGSQQSGSRQPGSQQPGSRPLDALPVATGRRAAAVLRRRLAAQPLRALCCVIVLVLGAAASLLPPVAIGLVVEAITASTGYGTLVLAVTLLAGGAVVQGVLVWLGAHLVIRVTEPILAELREDAMAAALDADAVVLERAGSGDLVSRITGDIDRLSDAAGGTLGAFVSSALAIAITLAGLAVLDWRFALAGLLAMPVQVFALRRYLRTSAPVYRRTRVAESARAQAVLESITGAKTVRALRAGMEHLDRASSASALARDLESTSVRVSTRFFGRLNLAEFIALGGVLAVGFFLVNGGVDPVGIGATTTAALFISRLFDPLNTVLGLFDTVQQAGASLTRVVGLIGMPRVAHRRPIVVGTDADIVLRDVGLSYAAGVRPALRDVDLTIRGGTTVAVVGASGSGKSTLAKLIAGVLDPTNGTVSVAGASARSVRESRGGSVVLLSQEAHVFEGPLASDLRLAKDTAGDDELVAALAAAGAGSFLDALPHGIATVLGPEGVLPSAAHAQQIALARLVLADPAVVLLDEATADAGSAAAVELEQAALRVTAGRTTIVIAHRLTQAVTADRVVVLDAGLIVEDGSHAELAAAGGTYASLWSAWADRRHEPECADAAR